MDVIKITGGNPLYGKVVISGAKNAALPLMAASLLTKDKITLTNIPYLSDITTMAGLLVSHGTSLSVETNSEGRTRGRVITLESDEITSTIAPYDIVRKMRASIVVLGPLLARFGHARVSLPGGCAIGTRPIDLHLEALKKMGAKITLTEGYIDAVAPENGLKGAEVDFPKVSVGATENILMAATLAEGETIINNAAREPEVSDLANLLNKMGAEISGIGSSIIKIKGVRGLQGADYSVLPDRIEAGTYAVAAAITGGELELEDINSDIMTSTLDLLLKVGCKITSGKNSIKVKAGKNLGTIDVATSPYPGFATDMQAQFAALMCLAEGISVIEENIFENRFMHVPELNRMGADIRTEGNKMIIHGGIKFRGAPVMASDLRASVALVLAGLAAEGTTVVNRVYHIDRGYERIEEKLSLCGAEIERVKG